MGLTAPIVEVEGGRVRGIAAGGVATWFSVPYAASTAGAGRWRPPASVQPWAGIRDATQPGPVAPQPIPPTGGPNLAFTTPPTSEDCLHAHVFAPAGARNAPVLFWIHGGSHRTGAGHITEGVSFARDGVVVVAINYRMGPLGSFDHPALAAGRPAAEPAGNYGLMDQLAALQWTVRNIRAFGGDPQNITLAGESAGGMSVLHLLACPAATGLVRRAIVQSGGGWFRRTTLDDKRAQGVRLAETLGLTAPSADDLRALDADALCDSDFGPSAPFVDGALLAETPTAHFAAHGFPAIPLLIGWNSGEDILMSPDNPLLATRLTPRLRAIYAAEHGDDEDAIARANFNDQIMGAPARWLAHLAARASAAFLYHFSYVTARWRPLTRTAWHATEMDYTFDWWEPWVKPETVTDDDRAMARAMHAMWVGFAIDGRPRAAGLDWPRYDAAGTLLEFGETIEPRRAFRKTALDAQETDILPVFLR